MVFLIDYFNIIDPTDPNAISTLYHLKYLVSNGHPLDAIKGVRFPALYGQTSKITALADKYIDSYTNAFGQDYVTYCERCHSISVGPQSLCYHCCSETKKVVSLFKCEASKCPCHNNGELDYDPTTHFGYICNHSRKKPIQGMEIRSIPECLISAYYQFCGIMYNTKRSETLANIHHCNNVDQLTWFNSMNMCSAAYHRGDFLIANAIYSHQVAVDASIASTPLPNTQVHEEEVNYQSTCDIICSIFRIW